MFPSSFRKKMLLPYEKKKRHRGEGGTGKNRKREEGREGESGKLKGHSRISSSSAFRLRRFGLVGGKKPILILQGHTISSPFLEDLEGCLYPSCGLAESI